MARIPTASRWFCEIASEGSSHNRLTSAEDNEEALLLRYPPIGLVDQGSLRGGNNQGQPYILGRNAEALRPKKGKYFKCRFLMACSRRPSMPLPLLRATSRSAPTASVAVPATWT